MIARPTGPSRKNIARFQLQLKSETDICQRKLLEGLLYWNGKDLKEMRRLPVHHSAQQLGRRLNMIKRRKNKGAARRKNTERRANRLLALLPGRDYARLHPHLEPVELKYRQSLYRAHKPIGFVYFIETGVGSLVNTMANGDAAEVGTIGNEGIVGLPLVLEDERAPTCVYVQAPGTGLKMKASLFKKELARSASLRTVMHHYTHAFFNQVAQSAACNQFHSLEQRSQPLAFDDA